VPQGQLVGGADAQVHPRREQGQQHGEQEKHPAAPLPPRGGVGETGIVHQKLALVFQGEGVPLAIGEIAGGVLGVQFGELLPVEGAVDVHLGGGAGGAAPVAEARQDEAGGGEGGNGKAEPDHGWGSRSSPLSRAFSRCCSTGSRGALSGASRRWRRTTRARATRPSRARAAGPYQSNRVLPFTAGR